MTDKPLHQCFQTLFDQFPGVKTFYKPFMVVTKEVDGKPFNDIVVEDVFLKVDVDTQRGKRTLHDSFTIALTYCPFCGRHLDNTPESEEMLIDCGWLPAEYSKPPKENPEGDHSITVWGVDKNKSIKKMYWDYANENWKLADVHFALGFYPLYFMYMPQLPAIPEPTDNFLGK